MNDQVYKTKLSRASYIGIHGQLALQRQKSEVRILSDTPLPVPSFQRFPRQPCVISSFSVYNYSSEFAVLQVK